MGLNAVRRLKAFMFGDFWHIVLGPKGGGGSADDPSYIKTQFEREFATFRYWRWNQFAFKSYISNEILKESPNHIFYDPPIGTDYPIPSIVFYKEGRSGGVTTFSVEVYDSKNPSNIANDFATKFKMVLRSTENVGSYYKYTYKMEVED